MNDNEPRFTDFTTIRELNNLYAKRIIYLNAPDYYKYFYKSPDHIIFLKTLSLNLTCRAVQGYNTYDFTHNFESEKDVKEFQHYMRMHGFNADITSIRGNEYHININWDLLNTDYIKEVNEANKGYKINITQELRAHCNKYILNDEAKQEQENRT